MVKKEAIANLAIALFLIILVAVGIQLQLNANRHIQTEHPPIPTPTPSLQPTAQTTQSSSPSPILTPTPTQTPTNTPITVSGEVNSIPLSLPFPSSLIDIQFIDLQTGANLSFIFPYNYPPRSGIIGGNSSIASYSVILINERTYDVAVTYYLGPTASNVTVKADSIGNFTVQAPDGEKAIIKNFT